MTAVVATGQLYVITETEHKGQPTLQVNSADRDRDWIAAARRCDDGQWYVMLGMEAAWAAGYDSMLDTPAFVVSGRTEARAAVEMFARLYFARPGGSR